MTLNNEIFDIKQKHLVGKLVLSTVSKGRILDICTPEDGSVITVSASDFKENLMRVTDGFTPILAEDFVSFLGQPVMAVFGQDMETVENFCSNVEIKIDTETETSVFAEQPILPYTWTYGDVSKYFVEDARTVESEFTVASDPVPLLSDERILAKFSDDFCHIKLSSQWPVHVKDTVAYSTGIPRNHIIINEKNFRADFDQLLILPSVWAAICAVAARKSGKLVELFTPATSWQPETHFKRSTVVSDQGKPLAEKITVETDFGAFPFFVEEACHNILAGLIPSYDISAVEVIIRVNKSTKAPASFFGDLGHSLAVSFTEYHFSRLAKELGKSPYEWRTENLEKISMLSEKVRKCLAFDSLISTLNECAEDSWFNRKYAAFSQIQLSGKKVSPIVAYSKGIGIACAQGVSGFSEKYPYGGPHCITLTLTEDDKVFISLGFHIPEDTKKIYRNIVNEQLGTNKEKVFFIDLNTDSIKDFGPNVLSRSITVIPKLLDNACIQIQKRLNSGAPKPLAQQVFYRSEKNTAFFEANTFGSVAISCYIDSVKNIPVIDKITARLKFGRVYETVALSRRIKQIIYTTISQVCPCAENSSVIDLKVKSNQHLPSGSCSSMLRGLTAAALTTAVSQALNHEIHFLPIYENDVNIILQKKKPKETVNENQLHN